MPASDVSISADFISTEFNIFNIVKDEAFSMYISDRMTQSQMINDIEYPAWDTNGDGKLSEEEIAAVEAIDIMGGWNWVYVASLEGLEYFTGLKYLNAADNTPLNSLNISKNTKLETLLIFYTNVGNMDYSNNLELQVLDCEFSGMTTLDLSANTKLRDLNVMDNTGLNSLDISKNTALERLICAGNNF